MIDFKQGYQCPSEIRTIVRERVTSWPFYKFGPTETTEIVDIAVKAVDDMIDALHRNLMLLPPDQRRLCGAHTTPELAKFALNAISQAIRNNVTAILAGDPAVFAAFQEKARDETD